MLEFLLGHSVWAFRSGELAFARGWPTWVLVVCIIVGMAAIAFTLLRRQLEWQRALVLGVLQAGFLALALLLLWRPVLNVEEIKERENVVAVLVDDSGSMHVADKAEGPTRLQQAVDALDDGVLEEIGDRSDLRVFAFSDRAQPVDGLQDIARGAQTTRIGDALDTVTQMAASVPVAAVVLVSDGADTADTLGEAALARLATAGIPIHTVGVGREQPENDLEVEQVAVPATSMSGATVRAAVSIRHQDQRTGRVRVRDAGQLIATQEVRFGDKPGLTTVTVEFPAGTAGVRDLTISVDGARGETRLANNERRAVLEVDGRRRSVLYVEGEPRWEYKFIRRALEGDAAVRLASAVRATPNRYYRQGLTSGTELEKGFPLTEEELQTLEAGIADLERLAALPTPHAPAVEALEKLRPGIQDMRAARNVEALIVRGQAVSDAEFASPSDAETAYREVLADLRGVTFGPQAQGTELARRHTRLVRELERKHRGVEQRALAQRERERITSRGLLEVTARELFRDYHSNEVQADRRYLRRPLAVDGVVHSVSRGVFGAPIVHLRTSNQFMPVDADFESLDQAGRLEPGTRVLLECEGAGMTIGRPHLNDCSIITTWH